MNLYQFGYRSCQPELYDKIVPDRAKLFFQEYNWLQKLKPETLAHMIPYHFEMKESLKKENWNQSYLDNVSPVVIKQMWIERCLRNYYKDSAWNDSMWKKRFAHAILYHSPEWFDCFPVEIAIEWARQMGLDQIEVRLLLNNVHHWRLLLNKDEQYIVNFHKIKNLKGIPTGREYNHAWEALKTTASQRKSRLTIETRYIPHPELINHILKICDFDE